MNAIEVNHLSRKFNKFSAVDDISFTIPKGEIFGLLGPNGAGKTTTIRILCGIMLPSAGSVNVLGYDVTRHPNEVKSQIGYMSQKFSLYNDLTPVENIMFYASIYGMPKKEQAKRIGELIEMSGLTNHQKQLTRT
ncbi:MAG: ABC transporter ATP-binding protein, partial [Anaerolineaceae bacterium]